MPDAGRCRCRGPGTRSIAPMTPRRPRPRQLCGSISPPRGCRCTADGWRSVRPADDVVLRPMADGGEGTLDAFAVAVPGATRMPLTVTGPAGTPVDTGMAAAAGQYRGRRARGDQRIELSAAGCVPGTRRRAGSARRSPPRSSTVWSASSSASDRARPPISASVCSALRCRVRRRRRGPRCLTAPAGWRRSPTSTPLRCDILLSAASSCSPM